MTLLHVHIEVLLKSLLDDITLAKTRIAYSTVGLVGIEESKARMRSLLMISLTRSG